MKNIGHFWLLFSSLGLSFLSASPPAAAAEDAKPPVIVLWPEGAPLAQEKADADIPKLTVYLPRNSFCQTAVVVIPGGGYSMLAADHEGRQPAEWLNSLGITAFVLEYRLGAKYHYPAQLLDAQRAIRYVRINAPKFKIARDRIGVWGFSAGGHLASLTGTHFDAGNASATDPIERTGSRPDFMILEYPVIEPLGSAAEWSFKQLLGEHASEELVRSVSTDLQVTKQTPPTFLQLSTDDDIVSAENGVRFYTALLKAGVPAEMHIYESGGHGYGLAPLDADLAGWTQRLVGWLRMRGLLSRP
jgi:acetyl esterase/lipase